MPQSEREFQAAVIEYAHLNGWLVHHGRAAQVREGKWVTPIQGDAGFPDLVMARGHQVVFAELKSEKGTMSPAQKRWIETLKEAADWAGFEFDFPADPPDHTAHRDLAMKVWRPSDWDEIETTLRRTT
jgi:hypothetical protein